MACYKCNQFKRILSSEPSSQHKVAEIGLNLFLRCTSAKRASRRSCSSTLLVRLQLIIYFLLTDERTIIHVAWHTFVHYRDYNIRSFRECSLADCKSHWRCHVVVGVSVLLTRFHRQTSGETCKQNTEGIGEKELPPKSTQFYIPNAYKTTVEFATWTLQKRTSKSPHPTLIGKN